MIRTALHVNGIIEVSFSSRPFRTTAHLIKVPAGWKRAGQEWGKTSFDETVSALNIATFSPKEKKCLNVACHLAGKEIRWGDKIGCESCHGDFLPEK